MKVVILHWINPPIHIKIISTDCQSCTYAVSAWTSKGNSNCFLVMQVIWLTSPIRADSFSYQMTHCRFFLNQKKVGNCVRNSFSTF